MQEEFDRRTRVYTQEFYYETFTQSGLDLVDQGREREGMALFKKAIDWDPTYAPAWGNLAVSYLNLGKRDSAEMCLEIAFGLNPFNSAPYVNMGAMALQTDL